MLVSTLANNRTVFTLVSKMISLLLRFCFPSLSVISKTKRNRDSESSPVPSLVFRERRAHEEYTKKGNAEHANHPLH